MARIIGIDLGTSNTYIYRKGRGIVVREPSVIAIDEEKSRVVALGEDAYNMIGKEPAGVKAAFFFVYSNNRWLSYDNPSSFSVYVCI